MAKRAKPAANASLYIVMRSASMGLSHPSTFKIANVVPQRTKPVKLEILLPQASLETPRLWLIPVRNGHQIRTAFEMIRTTDIGAGLDIPPHLKLGPFTRKLEGDEPIVFFLMMEKAQDRLVGLVGVWARSPVQGWPQILYGVRPEHRGHGYAAEGSHALIAHLFKSEAIQGVGAILNGSNRYSLKVIDQLGLGRISQWEGARLYGISREQFLSLGAPAAEERTPLDEKTRPPVLPNSLGRFVDEWLTHIDWSRQDTLLSRSLKRLCLSLLGLLGRPQKS